MAAVRAFSSFTGGAFGAGTMSVTKPTGTTAGDVLLAVVMQVKEATTAPTAPTGWTMAGSIAGGTRTGANGASAAFYRVAGSSEGTAYSFTSTATATVGMWACTGVDTTSPIAVVPSWTTGTSTSLVAPSVTAAVDALLICTYGVLFGSGAVTFSTPTGMTVGTATAQSGNYARAGYFSQVISSAGSTGTRTSTSSAAPVELTQSMSMVLAPASGGGGGGSSGGSAMFPMFLP